MIAERGNVDHIAGIADATCVVTLRDNRSRTVYGTALVGEQMPGGNQIGDIKQALDIAQARAARRGLRAVGFDPVRAHEKRMRGEEVVLDLSEPKDLRRCDLATIHLLKRECGYNTGTGDDQDYRALIRQLFPDLQDLRRTHGRATARLFHHDVARPAQLTPADDADDYRRGALGTQSERPRGDCTGVTNRGGARELKKARAPPRYLAVEGADPSCQIVS